MRIASEIAMPPTPTCSVFVRFYVRIVECSKNRGESPKGCPLFLFPCCHFCLLVPFLLTGFAAVMCFHPYLPPLFTIALVLFPLHFLLPQPLWPSGSPTLDRTSSRCYACSIFHHWWEDVLFTVAWTPAVTHSRRGTTQYSSWRAEVCGVTAGRSEESKLTGRPAALCVQGLSVCVRVCVQTSQSGLAERSTRNNSGIS